MINSGEKFSAGNVEALWFPDPERHTTAMREVVDTTIMQSSEGQRFSGLYLNRDFAGNSKPAIVIPGPFLGACNGPYRTWEGYQYANAFPDQPVVLIDMAGHGLSDPSTNQQRLEMLQKKGLHGIANAQTEAVRGILPTSVDDIIIIGDSLGARLAPDIALASGTAGFNPKAIIGHEMVGVDRRSSMSIAFGFYVLETLIQKQYKEDPDGADLRDAFERQFKGLDLQAQGRFERMRDSILRFAGKDVKVFEQAIPEPGALEITGYDPSSFSLYDVYKKDPILPLLVLMRSPLATDRGFEVLEDALTANPTMTADFVSGGKSKVARWEHMESVVTKLVDRYNGRLGWALWPEDSHGMSLADQQPRLAQHAAAVVEERFPVAA